MPQSSQTLANSPWWRPCRPGNVPVHLVHLAFSTLSFSCPIRVYRVLASVTSLSTQNLAFSPLKRLSSPLCRPHLRDDPIHPNSHRWRSCRPVDVPVHLVHLAFSTLRCFCPIRVYRVLTSVTSLSTQNLAFSSLKRLSSPLCRPHLWDDPIHPNSHRWRPCRPVDVPVHLAWHSQLWDVPHLCDVPVHPDSGILNKSLGLLQQPLCSQPLSLGSE